MAVPAASPTDTPVITRPTSNPGRAFQTADHGCRHHHRRHPAEHRSPTADARDDDGLTEQGDDRAAREYRVDHRHGQSRKVVARSVQAVERARQGRKCHDDQKGERHGPERGTVPSADCSRHCVSLAGLHRARSSYPPPVAITEAASHDRGDDPRVGAGSHARPTDRGAPGKSDDPVSTRREVERRGRAFAVHGRSRRALSNPGHPQTALEGSRTYDLPDLDGTTVCPNVSVNKEPSSNMTADCRRRSSRW